MNLASPHYSKMDDLVHRELCNVATKWKAIVLGLGQNQPCWMPSEVNLVPDGEEVCLWKGPQKENAKPKWSVLVQVLRSEAVEKFELVKELKTKYCLVLDCMGHNIITATKTWDCCEADQSGYSLHAHSHLCLLGALRGERMVKAIFPDPVQ